MNAISAAAVLGTLFAALVGVFLSMRKAPYERDGVFISTAEGATRILNSAMASLEKDNERKAVSIEELQQDAKAKTLALKRKDDLIVELRNRIHILEEQGHE